MNYINPCRDVEKMYIKLSIYYERLLNYGISYFFTGCTVSAIGS